MGSIKVLELRPGSDGVGMGGEERRTGWTRRVNFVEEYVARVQWFRTGKGGREREED